MTFVLYADFFFSYCFCHCSSALPIFFLHSTNNSEKFSQMLSVQSETSKCNCIVPQAHFHMLLQQIKPFHYHANCTQLTLTQLLYIIIYNFMPFIEWHFHTLAHNIIMNRKIQKHCPHQCCAHWTIGIFGIFGEQENYQNCLVGLGFL